MSNNSKFDMIMTYYKNELDLKNKEINSLKKVNENLKLDNKKLNEKIELMKFENYKDVKENKNHFSNNCVHTDNTVVPGFHWHLTRMVRMDGKDTVPAGSTCDELHRDSVVGSHYLAIWTNLLFCRVSSRHNARYHSVVPKEEKPL